MATLANHEGRINSDNWRDNAACRGSDPDLFFPIGSSGPAIEQIEAAKAVCASCIARLACLEYAIKTNQNDGVWGGTTEEERRLMQKGRLARQRAAM